MKKRLIRLLRDIGILLPLTVVEQKLEAWGPK